MSTDRYLFTGYYIEVGKIKVKHDVTVNGCPNCKTKNNRGNFCGSCGHAHVDYKKPATASSFSDLAQIAIENGVIDEEVYDDILDTFWMECNFVIPEGIDSIGVNTWVNYDMVQLQMIEQSDLTLLAAKAVFQPVIAILEHFDVKHEVKSGILYYSR